MGTPIRTLSTRVPYRNPWLSVREDQVEFADGSPGLYGVVECADFALIIPAEEDGFHLVEQFRYATGERSWEFPSGSYPPGESGGVEEMAAREHHRWTDHRGVRAPVADRDATRATTTRVKSSKVVTLGPRQGRLRAQTDHFLAPGQPFTQRSVRSRASTETRSVCASMTLSSDLYAPGISSTTPASLRHSTPSV